MNITPTEVFLLLVAIVVLYGIISHKISLGAVEDAVKKEVASLREKLAAIHSTAQAAHAAALAPVTVVNAPQPPVLTDPPPLPMPAPEPLLASGAAPVAPPPNTPAANASPGILSMIGSGTKPITPQEIAGVEAAAAQAAPGIDRRALRDLSDVLGPATVEGPAGTTATIACRRPAGTTVELQFGREPSNLEPVGVSVVGTVSVQGVEHAGGGQDDYGNFTFVSTGNDPITVTLLRAGALFVHRAN